MAKGRKPRWVDEGYNKGIKTYSISSWKYFHDFIQEHLLDNKNYVFRGQRHESWNLEPTLNRQLKSLSTINFNKKVAEHLENFKYSIRGRADFIKDIISFDDEIWAVGQHNFLATPFLDFTFSPYVAAYFAFYEKSNDSNYRIIYALSQKHVSDQINDKVYLYKPQSGHNPRLLNQSGLFVKFKDKDNLETIIKNYMISNPTDNKIKLYKIKILNSERVVCLKSLNKMNLNHNSLFPDLFGASIYCNTMLEIDKY